MTRVPLPRTLLAAGALVLLSAGINLAAQAPPPIDPSRVLQMALEAPRLIDYEGTKVIIALRNGRTETVTVAESHKRPSMVRLEYLSPEGVAGRLIVDNGTVAWHYEPSLNMAFQDQTVPDGLVSRDGTLLRRNYSLTFLGTDEVIGRQAYVIALDPKGAGVRRQLWVDRATGTVLRSEERDPSRGVLLTTYFSRISFSLNLPEALFQFRLPARARVFSMQTIQGDSMSPAALEKRVGFHVLIPPVLPEGYTFRGGAVSRFGSLTSVYLRYSDGGNLISFFEAPAGAIGWPPSARSIRVADQTGRFLDLGYFRVLIWEQGGLRVTAVGTAPTATLVTVASQIAAGREQVLVRDVSRRAESDPATIRQLRGEGLTFPEVARTLVLAQQLQINVPTAARYVRGTLSITDLARQLGQRPDALRQAVQEADQRASTLSPVTPAPSVHR